MSYQTYQYEIENEDDRYEFQHNGAADWETGRVFIAEAAAEDFHRNHDGWEASWPIEFSIFSEDDGFIGTFSVNCEAVPQFTALPHHHISRCRMTSTPANDNSPRPAWFDELLLKYEPFMRAKCAKLCRGLDKEEIYQEAAILCLRRWRLYDPEMANASLLSFLGFICREAAAHVRRQSKKIRYVEIDENWDEPTIEEQWAPSDADRLLSFCNPEQREAIELSAAGYDYSEIGAVVGVTKQGVQLRILAGRDRIKRKMRQADVVAGLVAVQRAANDNEPVRKAG